MMNRRTTLTAGHVLTALLTTACGQGDDVQEMTFDADVRRVVIDVDAGSVDVRGSEWRGVAVLGDMDSDSTQPLRIGTELRGDTVHVTAQCPENVNNCDAGLRLEVPRNVEAMIRTASGDVEVGDVSGDIEVSVGSGSVQLMGVGGTARVEVEHGNVLGMNLLRGDIWASTEQGNVDLHFVEPPREVAGDTVRGNVSIVVPKGDYEVFADSVEGEVNVEVCSCEDGEQMIFARSTYGNVFVGH